MGLLDWFSSSSKPDNVWRRLYEPGACPNPSAAEGASMYDKPSSGRAASSVWDEVLKSKSFRERRFSEVDKNGDGRVTRDELAAALPSSIASAERRADTAARMVAAADKDGDGAISAREWTDAVRGMDRHYGAS